LTAKIPQGESLQNEKPTSQKEHSKNDVFTQPQRGDILLKDDADKLQPQRGGIKKRPFSRKVKRTEVSCVSRYSLLTIPIIYFNFPLGGSEEASHPF